MVKLLILKDEQFKFNDILIDIHILRKLLVSNNLKVAINIMDDNRFFLTSLHQKDLLLSAKLILKDNNIKLNKISPKEYVITTALNRYTVPYLAKFNIINGILASILLFIMLWLVYTMPSSLFIKEIIWPAFKILYIIDAIILIIMTILHIKNKN